MRCKGAVRRFDVALVGPGYQRNACEMMHLHSTHNQACGTWKDLACAFWSRSHDKACRVTIPRARALNSPRRGKPVNFQTCWRYCATGLDTSALCTPTHRVAASDVSLIRAQLQDALPSGRLPPPRSNFQHVQGSSAAPISQPLHHAP